jgi:hypothetical protein
MILTTPQGFFKKLVQQGVIGRKLRWGRRRRFFNSFQLSPMFFCNTIVFSASIIEIGDIRNKAQWRR